MRYSKKKKKEKRNLEIIAPKREKIVFARAIYFVSKTKRDVRIE